MKKILMTGGGTAGHVTPNIALIPKLKEIGFEIEYVGSYDGIEKQLIENEGIHYTGISSGKLRRYFSWQNFIDPFRVIKGFFEARKLIKEMQPSIVFSKGGFVSVPVVIAAHFANVPTIIHESDITPGLANKIAMNFASCVCHTFPETAQYIPTSSAYTGTPIRAELYEGDKNVALKMCGFDSSKPVLLVMGGSLGAKNINDAVRMSLPDLLDTYQIAHLCGKDKYDSSLDSVEGYVQFEYIDKEMKDFLAMADIIVSRAGSNSICEIAALNKPNVLIPLSAKVSRGDQLLNAASYAKQGFSELLDEDTMTTFSFVRAINDVYNNRFSYIQTMRRAGISNGVDKIVEIISNNC